MSEPIKILYFAWLRERVGVPHEELVLPQGVATVAALIDHLAARGPGYAAAFANRGTVRCAINQEFAALSGPVRPGDEVGFFPPVTGG
jgi:molybdopterin synthase sulfur carrier subunit